MLRSIGTVALLGALALPTVASADPLPAGGTRLIGAAAAGAFTPLGIPADDSDVSRHAVSQDGTKIAFASTSDGLSDADDDTTYNVYVKDTTTGAVTLVSRRTGADGAATGGRCENASISNDGAKVAFTCADSLDAADTNGAADVYVRDLTANTTTLVSAKAGVVGATGSDNPDIAGNGSAVVFSSGAANFGLPTGQHVYLRDLSGTTLKLIDAATSGNPNGNASVPSISDDANKVAFASQSTNLVDNTYTDTNTYQDVFVRNVSGNSTVLASTINGNDKKASANGASFDPALSGNGTKVAFISNADDLNDGDTNASQDIHLRNLANKVVELVSKRTDGTQANGYTYGPSIDDSGAHVGFINDGLVLGGASNDARQAYVRNTTGNTTTLTSRHDGVAGDPAAFDTLHVSLNGDGSVAVLGSRGLTADSDPYLSAVFARDNVTGTTQLVSRPAGSAPFVNAGGDASTGRQALSADGRYALFISDASGLPGAPGDTSEVYRRDNVTGDVVLVSRLPGGGAAADEGVGTAEISADGNRIAFDTGATNMGSPDHGNVVLVRDLAADTLTLASRANGADGVTAESVQDFAFSSNGNRVAFITGEAAIGAANGDHHVFVRDLAAQTTTQVGADQAGLAYSTALDADGSRVAWQLSVPVPDGGPIKEKKKLTVYLGHVWVADVGGAPSQVDAGVADDRQSRSPSLSADGNLVAFDSDAGLAPADANGNADVYVRNLTTGTVTLASLSSAGAQVTAGSYAPELSADGSTVAFVSAGVLTDTETDGYTELYVRNLSGQTTALASRADGAGGAPDNAGVDGYAISASGTCVAYNSAGTNDGTGLPTEISRAWLRAVSGTCPEVAKVQPTPTPTATATPPAKKKRPVISKLKFKHKKLSFVLSAKGKVKAVVATPATKKGRKPKRVKVLRVKAHKGKNVIAFKKKRALKPGRYRLTLTAKANGRTSKAKHITIRVGR